MKLRHLALPLLIIGVGVFFAARYLIDNKLPNFVGSRDLYVHPGTSTEEIVDSLSVVAKRPASIARMFKAHDTAVHLKPGHYVVEEGFTSVYVARMLNNGWQTPVKMTLSGSMRRLSDISRKISGQMMIDSASVHQALCDSELLSSFGFDRRSVFALFIPDTYELYWTASVREILSVQKAAYDNFWTASNRSKAESLGLSPMQVSVLASIVKSESNHVPEYPLIASVYLNRLRKGMKLQADPTVAFCYDFSLNRILRKHLEVDSPYNTYRHTGLPPGPICVPDKASLNAVLNPDNSKYLYFCADPSFNGTHRFAVSYSQHMTNARAFQRALTERRKAGK